MDTNITNEVAKGKKPKKFLKWVLVIGIVVILNLFFASVVRVVYDAPEFNNFCEDKQVVIVPENKDECLSVDGQWTEDRFIQKGLPSVERPYVPVIETEREGYCDINYTCRVEYEDARDLFERNVFVSQIIFGVIAIAISFFLSAIEVIALSFSLGGVLAFIIGSMRYWSNMDEILRLIILGLALAVLIWLGIKKLKG